MILRFDVLIAFQRMIVVLMLFSAGWMVSGCTIQPEPLTPEETTALAKADRDALFRGQAPVDGSITLFEAMARSVAYNLEHRLKVMEEALAQGQLELSTMNMLPNLAASAGYSDRSNLTSSKGTGALTASTSSDRFRWDGSLTMTWNVLDFGVSWFQAHQDADRLLIARERRRKVLHNLIRDVRYAYWRAFSAQDLAPRIDRILDDVERALTNAKTMEREGIGNQRSPDETLTYQRSLIESLRQLRNLQPEMDQARTELAVLMNLKPGEPYRLAGDAEVFRSMPKIGAFVWKMEEMALTNLPELQEERYQARISVAETKKAIAQLFPGLEIGTGFNYDSNSYFVNQNWWSISARLTWNLMNLVRGRSRLQVAEAQASVGEVRRLALNMAALSQLHIALRNYQGMRQQMVLMDSLHRIDSRLHTRMENQRQARQGGEQSTILSAVRKLTTRAERDRTFALLQNAVGMLNHTLGMDPLPVTIANHDLKTISRAIARRIIQWEMHQLSIIMEPVSPEDEPDPSQVPERAPVRLTTPEVRQEPLMHPESDDTGVEDGESEPDAPEPLPETPAPPAEEEAPEPLLDTTAPPAEEEAPEPLLDTTAPLQESSATVSSRDASSIQTPEESVVTQEINQWAAAWSGQDVERYLAMYGERFLIPPKYRDRDHWRKNRSWVIRRAERIALRIRNMEMTPLDADTMHVVFDQFYHSKRYNDRVRKHLLFGREGVSWKILWECTNSCDPYDALEQRDASMVDGAWEDPEGGAWEDPEGGDATP
ncbi:MAG: TolC family protein [Magnetococcales bacterium]|nr:TolC family protein [Magnetococcales bacterium]